MSSTARILLVDDEPHVLSALSRSLRHSLRQRVPALKLELVSDPREALQRLGDQAYTLVISDQRMPGLTGVDVLARARELQPHAGRIMLSGQVDRDALRAAVNDAQIQRFLTKPWDDQQLADVVAEAIDDHVRVLRTEELADDMLAQRGEITPQERERRRLEQLEPGITRAEWGPDGALIMDPLP